MLKSVSAALELLKLSQRENGSFISYTTQTASFEQTQVSHSPFLTSIIFTSLSVLKNEKNVQDIYQKGSNYLLSQKSDQWSWNYWERDALESQSTPYPDDLDDTFCALSALFHTDKKYIDGTVFAKVVMQLTALEIKEGGPYRSWLVAANAPKVWKDVDFAVNANIAYFLSLCDITLPGLESFLESSIKNKKHESPYYVDTYPSIYFLSRFYKGKQKENLQTLLLSTRNNLGNWENPLQTALAVSSLLRLGVNRQEIKSAYDFLLKTQRNGAWNAYPFINEKITKDKTFYCGSPALTTALCIEALTLFDTYVANNKKTVMLLSRTHEKISSEIVVRVEKLYEENDAKSKKYIQSRIAELVTKDLTKQIPLLPAFFLESLRTSDKAKISKEFLIQLGLANVLGWIAYTIFDDVYDGDMTDMSLLPLGLIASREMQSLFAKIAQSSPKFHKIYRPILDGIDRANIWELQNCRFDPELPVNKIKLPRFGDDAIIAQKSLGHILGPLAILCQLSNTDVAKSLIAIKEFLTHFIIAKQLNDDAHDWQEDLLRGQLNPVSAILLKKWKKKYPERADKKSKDFIEAMKEFFWIEVAPLICNKIFTHLAEAEKELQQASIVTDKDVMQKLLEPIAHATQSAIEERESMLRFLKTYKA